MLDSAREFALPLAAVAAIAIFFAFWALAKAVEEIRDAYRRRIYLLAANIAMKHPALLASVWAELDLPMPTTETPRELEAITAEIVIPEDPYAGAHPETVLTASRPELEQHAVDLEAELIRTRLDLVVAVHEAERCAAEAARKDRTRSMYLRRLRRVDAVTHPGDPAFAVLHPSLARRMAIAA